MTQITLPDQTLEKLNRSAVEEGVEPTQLLIRLVEEYLADKLAAKNHDLRPDTGEQEKKINQEQAYFCIFPNLEGILTTITLEIPDEIAGIYNNLNRLKQRLYEDIVIAEFQKGNLSIREGARLLGLTYEGFIEWLGKQNIPFIMAPLGELEDSYKNFENFMQAYVKS
jgi:predicted HTH domain antitoxin